MSQHKNRMSYIYNPSNQSYEELMDSFVIRKKEFNKIVRELKECDLESSAQHYLIEGQRGTGKTSLLLRLRYEIENDTELSTSLLPVQFAEEQYNIFDLCRVWESVAEHLEDIKGFEELSDELDSRSEDEDYIIECFTIVEKYLKNNKKRLVLLLDNFGDILDKLSEVEQMRLRDIFHSSNYIQLIASSSRVLEHTYKHDKPFFEFFKIVKLDGLNKQDTNILLTQLSHTANVDIEDIIQNQSNRIETIRRLTGGIPRTIVLLFEIFLDDSANVFEDLELILDRVTPLYKHRMDDLPKQQQAIMDTIALNWDGITTKEIVEGLKKRGFDTKKVSAQLNILEKNDLIISKKIDNKNKIYFVKERFFNIWYLMRYGRKKNKTQVLWLVKFLQEWCSKEELIKRARSHIKCAQNGTLHPKGGEFMAEALACILEDEDVQHELLLETRKALRKYNPNIEKSMSQSDKELLEKADKAFETNNYKLVIKYLKLIKNKEAIDYSMLAIAYLGILDIKQVADNLDLAMKKNDSTSFSLVSRLYYDLNLINNQQKSLLLAQKAIELDKQNIFIFNYAEILLWNDMFNESISEVKEIASWGVQEEDIEDYISYFIFLLSKKQYSLAYDFFNEFSELKDGIKPIYYALITLSKDKYPKEYLKMGDELKETVDEILQEVEEKAKKYN